MLTFTKATLPDRTLLFDFMENYYHLDHLEFDREKAGFAFELLLKNPEFGQVWFIVDDNKPIGYFILTVGFSFEYHGFDAFLDELFISEEYRGKGIGSRVLEFLTVECKKRNVNTLHLEVEINNPSARTFYQKEGFEDHNRFLMSKSVT